MTIGVEIVCIVNLKIFYALANEEVLHGYNYLVTLFLHTYLKKENAGSSETLFREIQRMNWKLYVHWIYYICLTNRLITKKQKQ